MPTSTNETPVTTKFELAIQEGVSPCLWIPPHWTELKAVGGERRFSDLNAADASLFKGDTDKAKAKDGRMKDRLEKGAKRDKAAPTLPEEELDDGKWISPFASTTHVDETEFSEDDRQALEPCLKTNDKLKRKLNQIIGPESPGMKRLARIFEWVLYRATILMQDLNVELQNGANYETARTNYINFLRDLDDHEPEKGPKRTPLEIKKGENGRPEKLEFKDKASSSGYGRAIKWTCIEPVISEGKIVGTRVVVKWNPHISSSGIAIPH